MGDTGSSEKRPVDGDRSGSAASGRPAAPLRQLREVHAFRYVTVPNAPTYRAIVQLFHEAKQRYVIELRPIEVLGLLRATPYQVAVADEEPPCVVCFGGTFLSAQPANAAAEMTSAAQASRSRENEWNMCTAMGRQKGRCVTAKAPAGC